MRSNSVPSDHGPANPGAAARGAAKLQSSVTGGSLDLQAQQAQLTAGKQDAKANQNSSKGLAATDETVKDAADKLLKKVAKMSKKERHELMHQLSKELGISDKQAKGMVRAMDHHTKLGALAALSVTTARTPGASDALKKAGDDFLHAKPKDAVHMARDADTNHMLANRDRVAAEGADVLSATSPTSVRNKIGVGV